MSEEKDLSNKLRSRAMRMPIGNELTQMDIGKKPPQAIELEEAVLGAIMLEKEAITAIVEVLRSESFYLPKHQLICAAAYELYSETEPVDILTVIQRLKKQGVLEEAGGAHYISQLTSKIASAANVEFHARIVAQKYIQRELIRVSNIIIKDSYEETTDVFELLDKAEQNLFAIGEQNLSSSTKKMSDLWRKSIEAIQNLREKEDGLTGIPTGFSGFDRLTSGWQKSDLVILAARPGMGKTSFVLTVARNAAVDFNMPVAFFSLEMSAVQLTTRLISSEAELTSEKLRKGDLEEHEWQQLHHKTKKLSEAKLFIDDSPALNIFELRAKCRRLKSQHDIQLIIIDYLQLMSGQGGNGKQFGNREQEISNISRGLKGIAKELNVPVIGLSQLNRSVETRAGAKRPQLADLRESGAIEQDADMVIFLYRPEYYKLDEFEDGTPTKDMAEIMIAKHRNGATADIKAKFIGMYTKFEDYEENFSMPNNLPDGLPDGNFKTMGSRMNEEKNDFPEPPSDNNNDSDEEDNPLF
ncbi:MAG: replicative DNA helicase [Chitinophagales bacterium]